MPVAHPAIVIFEHQQTGPCFAEAHGRLVFLKHQPFSGPLCATMKQWSLQLTPDLWSRKPVAGTVSWIELVLLLLLATQMHSSK
ncbi:MAG TPA: hypothetical protein VN844_26820 [Pyrinomonadaceae bacterium]|nr:hypothetical protein [Pyrinomonadaceae bacterium]